MAVECELVLACDREARDRLEHPDAVTGIPQHLLEPDGQSPALSVRARFECCIVERSEPDGCDESFEFIGVALRVGAHRSLSA